MQTMLLVFIIAVASAVALYVLGQRIIIRQLTRTAEHRFIVEVDGARVFDASAIQLHHNALFRGEGKGEATETRIVLNRNPETECQCEVCAELFTGRGQVCPHCSETPRERPLE